MGAPVTPLVRIAAIFFCSLALPAFAQDSKARATSTSGGSNLTLPPGTDPKPTAKVPTEPPPMKPAPQLSEQEMDTFLRTAPITAHKVLSVGTTASIRATLSDGKLTHDAHVQTVDMYRPVFRGRDGTLEKNFRDSYKFNIAAYRLGRMLGIAHMIPMSVERDFEGKIGSYTWWVDNVWMSEAERRDAQIKPPATQFWVDQLNVVRVYDQLIHNTDRNQGNLIITPEWKLWMIDHTRAFRTSKTLLKKEALGRCDFKLLEALKKLNTVDLKRELGSYLRPEEIAGLLARRDVIVQHYQREISQKGEEAVLTGLPRSTPNVSLP